MYWGFFYDYGSTLLRGTPSAFALELPESELVLLQEHSPLVMTEPSGNCELLATRVPLKMQKLIDKNDQAYCVKYDPHEKLYKLFASEDKNTCSALEKFRRNPSY